MQGNVILYEMAGYGRAQENLAFNGGMKSREKPESRSKIK